MAAPKNRVIQKRVKKRERFARMARNRHRKDRNVFLAKAQNVAAIRGVSNESKIYHFSSGFIVAEVNGKIDFEMSMLNKDYISNAVSIMHEGDKILCVTLHKTNLEAAASDAEVLKEWESRGDPYWAEWAQRVRKHLEKRKEFIEKNRDQFITNKVDKKWIDKRDQYIERRNQIMSEKPCMEKTVMFDGNGNCQAELSFNSKYISWLEYGFDEFADKVLREGIPRTKAEEINVEENLKNDLEFGERVFEVDFEHPSHESLMTVKNNKVKKATATIRLTGYFVKHAAEIRLLIWFDNCEPDTPEDEENSEEDNTQQSNSNLDERKEFLERYYFNRRSGLNLPTEPMAKEEDDIKVKSELTSTSGDASYRHKDDNEEQV